MEYAREEIEFALVRERQRKLGLDMELAKGVNPDLIAKNVERCDAQIAVLEVQIEKLPSAEDTSEADANVQARNEARELAHRVKAGNEIAQAAAKASNVPGVTPETVLTQDPDAVLAVISKIESAMKVAQTEEPAPTVAEPVVEPEPVKQTFFQRLIGA